MPMVFLKLIRNISGIPFPWAWSRADFASQKVAPALLFECQGRGWRIWLNVKVFMSLLSPGHVLCVQVRKFT